VVQDQRVRGVSLWEDSLRRFKKDTLGVVCFVVICVYFVVALLGLAQVFGDPMKSHPLHSKAKPSFSAAAAESVTGASEDAEALQVEPPRTLLLLGTDIHGKSVLARVVGGTWVAIALGFSTALLSTFIGGVLGALSGWFGRSVDSAIVWLYSTVSSIPSLVLIMSIVYVFKQQGGNAAGFIGVFLAMGLTYWVGTCRVIRGEFMKLKQRDYVLAAESLGISRTRIIFGHVMPNASHLLFIMASLIFVEAIKSEVVLSYLGVGLQGQPSWGLIIQDAETELTKGYWWQMTFTSIALFGIVLAFQVFGDSLRDALDPRLRT
jgi:peptide/nickel transport system permease protein